MYNPPNHTCNWMQLHLNEFGDRPVRDVLCVPASHDSGMWYKSYGTAVGGTEANILVQTQNIYDQLRCSPRSFNFRPSWQNDKQERVNIHMDKVLPIGSAGWLGGTGATIEECITQINDFTSAHPELIVVNISTFREVLHNGDRLPDSKIVEVLNMFKRLNHISFKKAEHGGDPCSRTLRDFIGSKQASVLVVVDQTDVSDQKIIEDAGYWRLNELNFSNWSITHTQDAGEAIASAFSSQADSVLALAAKVQGEELSMYPQTSWHAGLKNTITLDNICNADSLTLALASMYLHKNRAAGKSDMVIVYGGLVITAPEIRAKFAELIQTHSCIVVQNDLFGQDPWGGIPKCCMVYWTSPETNQVQGRFAREGSWMDLATDIQSIEWGGETITDQNAYDNVLRSIVQRGIFTAKTENLGGRDP